MVDREGKASDATLTPEYPPHGMLQRGVRITGTGIIGFWLLFLYPLLTWLVIGTLSSYGFQEKVERFASTDGQALTIPTVMRFAQKLAQLQDEESQLADKSLEIQEEMESTEVARSAKRDELVSFLAQHQGEVQVDGPLSFGNEDFLEQFYTSLVSLSDDKEIVRQAADLWRAYQAERRKFDRQQAEQQHLQEALAQTRQGLDKLLEDTPQAIDVVSELEFMRYWGFKRLALMPNALLTLLLTLSMGALGSLIYITRDYFSRESQKPFSWYLFRPFLGMVTAIAVFVLAKAGQLTISDAGVTEGVAENLNPYFISFLAIISGLLSEQATEKIRAAGSSVFGVEGQAPPTPERWAVGLKEQMGQRGKTAAELAGFVDQDESTVQEWCDERRPVPTAAQSIIAGWLGIPRRRLFTDLPPGSQKEPGDKGSQQP